jgi:hypothetical protein
MSKRDAEFYQAVFEDEAKLAEHLSNDHTTGELVGRILALQKALDHLMQNMRAEMSRA